MDTILIVDDNLVNLHMLNNILKDEYEVLEADSGAKAISILKGENHNVAAMLLDIVMPGMDGFDVLREIRNDEKLTELPVIIQTGKDDDAFEVSALKMGATDFVTKPYKPEALKARLKNAIDIRKVLNQISNLNKDDLTGLMSLNSFYYEGARWIAQSQSYDFDIIAADVVHFSAINDSKGMEGANAILCSMSEKIKDLQKSVKFLASRVYADRFVMLVQRREGYRKRLLAAADDLTDEYARKNINVHFKFGIYEIAERNVNLPRICGRAFSATNRIKDFYKNRYVYYDDALHNDILYEEKINDQMDKALKNDEFVIYFQPKYDIFMNSIAGAEALVRWEHPTEGIILPGKFIPIFEKNGFIVELDQYVWEKTASLIKKWYKNGKKTIPVSVNISRTDIENMDVVKCLCNIIKKYQIAPELLHLEITESAYMQDTEQIIQVVQRLKEKGFIIEMDDFGSGYSSLNMLAKLPINILKLDMKFIQSIENSMNAKTIIEYTVGLAKWMNLPVVAEGVETKEQLELLKQLECNYVQGYIFAKPMPASEFEKMLRSSLSDEKVEIVEGNELYVYNTGKKYNMLIVEDLQLNRSIIRSYFEDSFSIVEAGNGEAAWDYLNTGAKVDIILMDIYMPKMNGFELLDKIKKDARYKKYPVLVVSSRVDQNEAKKVFELGADAFLPKPFTAEGIIDKVRILLRAYNIIEDMNIWDLKDTIDNPWMRSVCDEISIICKDTGHICRLEGEKFVETSSSYQKILKPEIYHKCLDEIKDPGQRYTAYKQKEFVIDLQMVEIDKTQYIICFKKNIKNAEML